MAKIFIFSAFYKPHFGGVERYTEEFSNELARLGHKVFIITSNTHGNKFTEEENSKTVIRLKHYFFLDGRLPFPSSVKEVSTLNKLLKSELPDLVILNMRAYPLSILGARLAKRHDTRTVLIDHISGRFDFDNFFVKAASIIYDKTATFYLKNKIDKFYGVSKKVVQWLREQKIFDAGVVHNGINPNAAENNSNAAKKYNLEENCFNVVFAGRLLPEKGVMVLADAFSKLKQYDIKTKLIIIGDGPLYSELKNFNSKDVVMTGSIPHEDVTDILKSSQCVVIPSYYPEGLPTLILEAGITECALIATKAGGTEEVITHEENGILIDKRSVNDIFSNILELSQNPEKTKRLASNLKNTVLKNFTWKKIVREFSEMENL